MDSAALMYAGGEYFEQYGMVAAKDYFFDNEKRNSFLSKLMNLIPADRGASRESIVNLMVACREFTGHDSRNIIIYPEGTRSETGEMAPMKKGAAMIATELGLPIVPVYINGTHRAYPKGGKFIKPARIRLHISEAIDPARFREEHGGRNLYSAITTEMENRIRKLQETHGRT
jgi:1-acyl-sn-glycerol-3-phosphate acyltransferase